MSRLSSNVGNLSGILKRLQGAQSIGPLQQAAVDAQKGVRTDVERLFREQAEGFSENVGGGLRQVQTEQVNRLGERGLSPAAVAALGDLGAGRESQLTLGRLQDALLGNRVEALSGISKNLSNIFTGSTDSGTALMGQLLGRIRGLGGRGDISEILSQLAGRGRI